MPSQIKQQINYMLRFCLLLLVLILTHCAPYNKQFSQTLNRLSAITHCTQEQITSWSCRICQQGEKPTDLTYIYLPLTNVMGYVGYLKSMNAAVVVMRGTTDIKNWLENFSYRQVQYGACKGCMIHEGFYLDYLSVAGKINTAVKNLIDKYPDLKIYVTGSSLGGALATIAALQLQLSTSRVLQLHVFGCPRVGNPSYSQYLSLKLPTLYRVIHSHDIVPHVPLQSQNYHHPGYEILYDSNMDAWKQCDASGEDPDCSDAYYPDYSVRDHTSYWYKPVEEDVCTPV